MVVIARREVRFRGAAGELAGEVWLPESDGLFAAVTLLHGASGGERRFYRAYAERFVAEGLAVLLFDRRGNGESEGPATMNLYELAADAVAAVSWLREQPEVDAGRVGLWGYSNGAWVASLVAVKCQPAFLVLAGAAGVTPARSEIYRRTEDLRSQGVGEESVGRVERVWKILFEFMVSGEMDASAKAELDALTAVIAADSELERRKVPEFARLNPMLDSVPRVDRPPHSEMLARAGGSNPDMAYDPIVSLEHLRCPVLVVMAENDANLPPAESVDRFKSVGREKRDFSVMVMEGADHLFSHPDLSEERRESALREPLRAEEYRPGYLELMAQWIAEKAVARTR